jgi:hypothetical protein
MALRSWQLLGTLLIGGIGGLWSAHAVLGERPPFQKVEIGPWQIWPKLGSSEIDPYARAILARGPHLPLGAGEGLAILAERDSEGRSLSNRCSFVIAGRMPASRGWTVTLQRDNGEPFARGEERLSISDAELVYAEDGRFELVLSRAVQPGNWLPLPAEPRFQIVLRLYDTPISGTAGELSAQDLPQITARDCTAGAS